MIATTLKPQGRDPFRKKSLEEFLRGRRQTTAKTYQIWLVQYLNWVYGEEKTVLAEGRVDIAFYSSRSLQYLAEYDSADKHAALLADFVDEYSINRSPKTMSTAKSAIIQYLAANKIYLPQELTRHIRTGNRVVSADRLPTREEIRAILDHSDLCGRCYVLMLVSSGMRPSEALGLTWDDIDEQRGMVCIPAPATKTGVARVTFLSQEALEALKGWKGYYPTYCRMVEQTTAGTTVPDRTKVFPVTYRSMLARFTLLLKKAGVDEVDEQTGRRKVHLHGFRKYFRTNLAKAATGNSVDLTEALMGHEGYLTSAYVRLTIDELETFYRQNEHLLWVFKEQPINERELRELQLENAELKSNFKGAEQDILELFDRIDRLKSEIRARDGEIEEEQKRVMAEDRRELGTAK